MNFKFSVAIITLNEEKNIERCLKSVSDLSDDIVVVDSGSIDKTKEICEAYNVRFYFNEFKDYGTQKSYAANLTKYNFVLNIDADEVLSDELRKSILSLKNLENRNIAFSFNRLNFYCGKAVRSCGWYPDKKIRLWNKNFGNWEGMVHEKLVFKTKPEILHLKGDLLHYTYNSYLEHFQRSIKYAAESAEKEFKNGKRASLLKVYTSFCTKFFIIYIIKLGFLDGLIGFIISITTAYATFFKNLQLYRKQKLKNFCE